MTITDERLREILAGCEGVTPGPWIASGVTRVIGGTRFMFVNKEPEGEVLRIPLPDRPVKGFGATICDQRHISRLDPQTVSEIVTRLLAAEAELLALREAAGEAGFLLERLRDFDSDWDDEEAYRQFAGHVVPSMERLSHLLAALIPKEPS